MYKTNQFGRVTVFEIMNLGIKLKAFEHVISVSNSCGGLGGISSLPVGPVQNPDGGTGSEIIEGLHTSVSSTST